LTCRPKLLWYPASYGNVGVIGNSTGTFNVLDVAMRDAGAVVFGAGVVVGFCPRSVAHAFSRLASRPVTAAQSNSKPIATNNAPAPIFTRNPRKKKAAAVGCVPLHETFASSAGKDAGNRTQSHPNPDTQNRRASVDSVFVLRTTALQCRDIR